LWQKILFGALFAYSVFRGYSHSQCGMMLARARADCVGKVMWNGDAVDPGRRSMTHLPWATIVRPYGTFSLCCAEVDRGFCGFVCFFVANRVFYFAVFAFSAVLNGTKK
jgi:hypothetical protein